AGSITSDAILFNIDSKSSSSEKNKEAILSVFLKVFNEMLGYCETDPYVADLERWLVKNDKYEEFKIKFEEINGSSWLESRSELAFLSGDVIAALIESESMDEKSAESWHEKISRADYSMSIEEFAKLVKEYIDTKPKNHHVVFFIDEMGQYIGDNTDLMLNLQTLTEDLGRICKGQAWVVVTSQQAIDSITEVKGNDFSKIQGRFDTRINLTSADAAEVIKKRILEKTEKAKNELITRYENEQSIIANLIVFTDSVEKKSFADEKDFYEVYPFIPYQFNLLSRVLTAVRQHGSSGKHLSEGERSMLAMFKESAMAIMNEDVGALVSFDNFYNAIEKFLDHDHASVIINANRNEIINPNREENCFNVKVLKTLFLIKYVIEIEGNIENVTTLMASHIHDDRLSLKEKVTKAMGLLLSQTYITQNGEV
ncbi:MAG: BREX system P-loop protein BrxC, partial [Gallicola sp.]|nr:BREX system P-loop protein BrxC [Gallicola sp.]